MLSPISAIAQYESLRDLGNGLTAIAVVSGDTPLTPSKYISAASTNATNVKPSAGKIGGIQTFNNTATIGYLKLYDKATAPVVGTDIPVKVILIPANTAGAGVAVPLPREGINFTNGIGFAITTGIADNDTGAVAASAIVVNIDSK